MGFEPMTSALKVHTSYRRIVCDVICLHVTMNCDPLTQDKMVWILEEQNNTKLSSDFESDISNNTYMPRLWKLKILQCLYELISVLPPSLAASFENL